MLTSVTTRFNSVGDDFPKLPCGLYYTRADLKAHACLYDAHDLPPPPVRVSECIYIASAQ